MLAAPCPYVSLLLNPRTSLYNTSPLHPKPGLRIFCILPPGQDQPKPFCIASHRGSWFSKPRYIIYIRVYTRFIYLATSSYFLLLFRGRYPAAVHRKIIRVEPTRHNAPFQSKWEVEVPRATRRPRNDWIRSCCGIHGVHPIYSTTRSRASVSSHEAR